MMKSALVLGAAGMLGRKLTARLVAAGVPDLVLHDVVPPDPVPGATVHTSDLAAPGVLDALLASRPAVVFHLAAVVSGEAEADLEKGYRVNLDATRLLLDAIRATDGYTPRLVFASSLAVFGAPLPAVIPDDFHLTPLTSYGTQKAMGELMVADYTRRGFVDGVSIRLPTVCIRPGKPNKAASGFFSGILREPLNGQRAVLPVPDTLRHWFASPRAAVGFLLHAATLSAAELGGARALTMPGISATVGEEIEALRRVAGDAAVALIDRVPDPAVLAIVSTWAQAFRCDRALALGFRADTDLDAIVRVYLEDELGQ